MSDDTGIAQLEMEQRTIRERIANMAMTSPDSGWALGWSLLQIETQIEDVGNQLYAISEALRERGDG